MEGVGAEVSQKIRLAIKAKLMEIGVFVDEELPDYVMVMVANKRSKEQMDEELQLFLGKHTSLFTTWLHQVLQKLQEVTVANLGSKKRKSTDDSKKKKKTKHDGDKKRLKKKIKVEPVDVKIEPNREVVEKNTIISTTKEGCDGFVNAVQSNDEVSRKVMISSEAAAKQRVESTNVSKVPEESVTKRNRGPDEKETSELSDSEKTSKIAPTSCEELDDEDCINIRTDGELLYTADEMNSEEPSKSKEKKKETETCSRESSFEESTENHNSPRSPARSRSPSNKLGSHSKSPLGRHKSSPARGSSSQRHDTRLSSPASKRKVSSRSSSTKNRYSQSPRRKNRSRSPSPTQRHSSHSRSPPCKKVSQPRTPPRKRTSRSKSPLQKKFSCSRSPVRRRESRSRSPVRRRASRSRSPVRRRGSRSKSPVGKHVSRSRSPGQRDRKKLDKQTDVNQISKRESNKRLTSPKGRSLLNESIMVDARELLNRKKAARESEKKLRSRSRSRERRWSPLRRKRVEDRDGNIRFHSDEKEVNNRSALMSDRELSNRKFSRDDKDRGSKDHLSAQREDKPLSKAVSAKTNSRVERKSDLSKESKPIQLKRSFRNNADARKGADDDLDVEEHKRSGPSSRVVARPQEPEDDVDTSVPSVVKVTPRPRRPASQQASSTLIMKAISEANKSLATVPQRPDTAKQGRKESESSRSLRHRERIPPEKIAISISNPQALQPKDQLEIKKSNCPPSPRYDESARNKSPSYEEPERASTETDADNNVKSFVENLETDQIASESQEQEEETVEPVVDSEPVPELEEELDTQFVVTLNGYDPDGLYSQSEMDPVEDDENEDWLKENLDEGPLATSSTNALVSPQSSLQITRECKFSTVALQPNQAINTSNLIEVKPNKIAERCKYWPACRLGDKCIYHHPTKPCKVFPACKFGDSCLYIHPQCKFNALCTRKDCVFAHSSAHTPLQPAAVPKPKVLYAAGPAMTCKFYPNCTNPNCQFVHPTRAVCRFGLYCTKRDCLFDHNQVAPVDKLKWSRVAST